MSARRRLTSRESWLVALLPATLVLVVATLFLGGNDEADQLQRQMNRAVSGRSSRQIHDELAKATRSVRAAEKELERLDGVKRHHERALEAAASVPEVRPLVGSQADRFHRLGLGLKRRELRLIASEPATTGRGGAEAQAPRWRFTVLGTWQRMRSLLEDAEAFPPGLALASIEMEAPRPGTTWRKWVLTVDDTEVQR